MTKMKIGIIGCGSIIPAYLNYLGKSEVVEIHALADILPNKAHERAAEFGIENVFTVDQMLQSEDIELILNLTIPSAHASVSIAALEHGKHVYVEKPLSISLEEAKQTLDLAEARHLRVGCAPDTFLGAGLETCRQVIEQELIGKPIAAAAFMMGAGPEDWHPNPEFFYAAGGGPMLDMGPYYLTALVHLLGPIARISGSAGIQTPERIVKSGPHMGKVIPVSVPTHYSGTLDFTNGAIGTLITSFDIPGGSTLPWIEIYGTKGTLAVPDPNMFDGDVRIRLHGSEEWNTIPHIFEGEMNERGRGIEDMARAIAEGRDHRASGLIAYHVLEAMYAFETSSREGRHVELSSARKLSKKSGYLVPAVYEEIFM